MKKLIVLAVMVTLNASAYCDHGITASGELVRDGICAVDRINGITVPFGTRIIMPDGKVLVVKDRLGGNLNNHLDIWMPNEDDCWKFGRKDVECKVELP